MGFSCSLGLEDLVAIDTKRLQLVLGQALQQLELELSSQESRILELEKKSPEELLFRLQQAEHGHAELAAGAEVAERGRVELSRRLGEHDDRFGAVDRLQHDARLNMQAIEARVKLAEDKALEYRSDTKAVREAGESQLVALGRFEQKLEDVNATAKRALENDVDQLRQNQEKLADKLERQFHDLQETFCSRTVAEAMRQDMDEQDRALQSAVDSLRQQLMEEVDVTALEPPPLTSSDRSLGRSSSVVRFGPGTDDDRQAATAGVHDHVQQNHVVTEAEGDSHCLLCTKSRVVSPAPAVRGIDGQVYLLPPANNARPMTALGSPSLAHGSHGSPTASRARPFFVRGINSSSHPALQEERPSSAAVTTPLPVCVNGCSNQPQQLGCFGTPLAYGSRGSWPRRSFQAGSASSGHASRPASASRTRLQRDRQSAAALGS